MPEVPTLLGLTYQICSMEEALTRLEKRVSSLEHYSNQSSILVDTLGDVMEELKKQEHWHYTRRMSSKSSPSKPNGN